MELTKKKRIKNESQLGRLSSQFSKYVFLCFYTVISLYPLYFTLISSFKTDQAISINPFSLPSSISFDNYFRAWNLSNMAIYFKNSVLLTGLSCVILIFFGTSVAYALNRFQFKGKKTLFIYFIVGMMIPAQSTILPLAFDMGRLHIHDSLFLVTLIITAFQLPLNILIVSGFVSSIPFELEEAASIDGSGPIYTYYKIVLPLLTPAIVTITIMNFLNAWNNMLFPLVFINSENLKTISIGLLSFFGEKNSDTSGAMAAIVISSLPPLLVYIFSQEMVEKGMTAGAVKG